MSLCAPPMCANVAWLHATPAISEHFLCCSMLDRRLKSRIPRPRGEGVPEGRSNLKRSEEDFWHAAGAYDYSTPSRAKSSVAPGEAECGEPGDTPRWLIIAVYSA